ncbi:MAG: hypothetical protein WKG07_11125 [Hymenobacter sp.]
MGAALRVRASLAARRSAGERWPRPCGAGVGRCPLASTCWPGPTTAPISWCPTATTSSTPNPGKDPLHDDLHLFQNRRLRAGRRTACCKKSRASRPRCGWIKTTTST